MEQKSDLQSPAELEEQIARLKRRIDREVRARKSAERLLEEKSLDLYNSNRKLARLNADLERTVNRRTNTMVSLIKNLQVGILLEDDHRRVLLVNELLCEYLGLDQKPDDLIGTNFTESTIFIEKFQDDSEEISERMADLVANREMDTKDVLELKSGKILKRQFIPIYSENEYLGHLWKFQDITQQHLYEEQIRRSEEKYRGIIENMQLGLLEVDLQHNILRAYDWFCDMTGYEESELIGKNANELLLPPEYQHLMDRQDEHRIKGKPGIYEVELIRKDGRRIWVLISGAPFHDLEGNVIGSIGIHYNITDRKALENELREANDQAEHARQAEKQFLANMSHEIRNPINAIAGLSNLLYDTKLNKEQLDYLDNIKYAADILLGLISDILDISKIEAGKMELNEREVELKEVLKAVIQTAQFKTNNPNITFKWHVDPQLTDPVIVDPTVINQILLNLIGNAIKFTEKGEISIQVETLAQTSEEIKIQCTVSDTGIGISPDQMEAIFETFRQASKQTKLKYGGTGLGLSIVRQLVKMYKGHIDVRSKEGEGSSFFFTMTFRKAPSGWNAQELKPAAAERSVSKIGQILVVEDNKINQQYLIGLLKKWKLEFDIANNGQEGLEWLEKKVYDVILMDIRMPVMDGYEATIRIRSSGQNINKDIPIVALTASALVDEKERALAAGMNFHLTKPFSPDQLFGILNQINEDIGTQTLEETEKTETFVFSAQLDQTYLEAFYGDDFERAHMMFGIFIRTITQEVEALKDSLEKHDLASLREVAHRIKPNFTMVGLTEETDRMQRVEVAADARDEQKVSTELKPFFDNFDAKLEVIKQEHERLATEVTN